MTYLRRSASDFTGGYLKWLLVLAGAAAIAAYFLFPGDGERRNTNLDLTLLQLEEQVVADPQNPVARLAMAIGYLERGFTGQAAEQFEQVLVLSPDNQTALIGLGQVRMELGDLEAAEEALLRVVELNEENERRYTIEQLNGVYHDLGLLHIKQGELEEARGWLLEALKVNPTDADSLLVLGATHERLGDFEAADAAFLDVVRLVPDYRDAYEAMAQFYEAQGREAELSYAVGMLNLVDGEIELAVTQLERAVQLSPELAVAHEGLGMAYESSKRPEDALSAYERALQLDPQMFLSDLAVQRLNGS